MVTINVSKVVNTQEGSENGEVKIGCQVVVEETIYKGKILVTHQSDKKADEEDLIDPAK